MKKNGEITRFPVDKPQYFFDDSLIADRRRLVRRWLPAKVYPKPVIEPDRPWEDRILAFYGTVLPDNKGYRMYYTSFSGTFRDTKVMVATSQDGFFWEKPNLGLVNWRGSKANNIVLHTEEHLDSPSLIYDLDDEKHPYKMLYFQSSNPYRVAWTKKKNWGLYTSRSKDGFRWSKPAGRPCLIAGDRTSLMATKTDGKFVAYTRHREMVARLGYRAVYRTESKDFRNWTEPVLVMAPDSSDKPNAEIYGLNVFQRPGWHLGLVDYWHGTPDVIETYLAFSRDGKKWIRPLPRKPFIAATYDWNRAWSSCASNGPVIINEQMVFYFGGRWVSHNFDSAQQSGVIGYASLPLDRFCALEGKDGRLDTVPIQWPGGNLILNADTRKNFASHPLLCKGEIAVEVLDEAGKPLPEWSGKGKAIFRGNTHCRCKIFDQTVKWQNQRSLSALKGRTIRFRFHLKHARLFTFSAGA